MASTGDAADPGGQVLLLDPAHQVPDYDRYLAAALARQGWAVRLAASPLLAAGRGDGPDRPARARAAVAGAPIAAAEAVAEIAAAAAPALADPGPSSPASVRTDMAFAPWLAGEGPLARLLRRHPPLRRLARLAAYPAERRRLDRSLLGAAGGMVLHQQWSLAPLWDAPLLAAARRAGRPAVLTVHNVLPHERRPWQPAVWRALYRRAPALIVHSAHSRRGLEDLVGADLPPVHVIPMPPDPPDAAAPTREAARAALGLAPEVPLALFLGHVRPYKGLDLLLEAWPAVRRTLPAARLWVRGALPGGAGAEGAWRVRIEAAGGAPGIDFRPGYLPREDLLRCLAAADLVLLPYRRVDMSAVLALALGHGRAVLATAVGGLPEALAGGGGLLVPPHDAAALAAAAVAVLGDEVRRSSLEAEARLAAARWTWDDAAAATAAVYRDLPAAAPGAGGRR